MSSKAVMVHISNYRLKGPQLFVMLNYRHYQRKPSSTDIVFVGRERRIKEKKFKDRINK